MRALPSRTGVGVVVLVVLGIVLLTVGVIAGYVLRPAQTTNPRWVVKRAWTPWVPVADVVRVKSDPDRLR